MSTATKSMTEIAQAIEEKIGVKTGTTRNVMRALTEVACEEISAGRPFQIPQLVKITPVYKKGLPKGRDVRDPSTGIVSKAETAKPPEISVKAKPLSAVKKAVPGVKTKAAADLVAEGRARIEAAAARKAEREAQAI